MQFNRRADYALSRGSGREIPVEEMLTLCLATEEEGLVPIVSNIALMDRMDYICYCCSCCCTGLEPLKKVGNFTVGYAKSRFLAEVDQEACQGCKTCIERCHFDAIEMGRIEGSKKRKAAIDAEKCFGCGACVLTCEPKALTLKLVRPPEHIPSLNAYAMR
jgi:ferredoxin